MHLNYLDHLAQLLQCSCLSDLRFRRLSSAEARKLLSEPEEYPLIQYQEAVQYILADRSPSVSSPAEAKQAIVSHLK